VIARRSFRDGLPVKEAQRLREIEAQVQAIHERNIRAASEARQGGRRRRPAEDDVALLVGSGSPEPEEEDGV